jgi:ribosomal protein S18 acetylase RimI-like enzyme
VENEVICGFVTTGPPQDSDLPDVGELWAIYVDPQYWGKGVGRLLVTAGRDQMRRDGAREALLWVFAGNHRARRFYELDGCGLTGLATSWTRWSKCSRGQRN